MDATYVYHNRISNSFREFTCMFCSKELFVFDGETLDCSKGLPDNREIFFLLNKVLC